MSVAVGRFQLIIRWMPRDDRYQPEVRASSNVDKVQRAYQRQLLSQQMRAERERWEAASRHHWCR